MKKLLFLIFVVALVWVLWGAVGVERRDGKAQITIDEKKPMEKIQKAEQKAESLFQKETK
ncbi:MAG: hypothetical protein MK108_19435 [Mariniblastus sp.]|nr:hypothetical protein [Mariniblastus sp.]